MAMISEPCPLVINNLYFCHQSSIALLVASPAASLGSSFRRWAADPGSSTAQHMVLFISVDSAEELGLHLIAQ